PDLPGHRRSARSAPPAPAGTLSLPPRPVMDSGEYRDGCGAAECSGVTLAQEQHPFSDQLADELGESGFRHLRGNRSRRPHPADDLAHREDPVEEGEEHRSVGGDLDRPYEGIVEADLAARHLP